MPKVQVEVPRRIAAPMTEQQFTHALQTEATRINRSGGQLGLIIFGLDHFQDLYQRLGRPIADVLLDHLGSHLARRVRSHDRLARLPGGEFGLLTPGMELSEATGCAVKLRHLVTEFHFNLTGHICASFGVTHFMRGETVDLLQERARRALEHARASGGNRVSAARADA